MERILVGLDGSAGEPAVIDAARDLAQRTGAKIILFRAITVPVALPSAALAVEPDALGPLLEEDAQKQLEQKRAALPAEVVIGTRVSLGTPWQAICDAAREERADMIVIGSHGYGGIDRFIGTTAAKVVNHADCSVLVVRPPPRR